MVARAMRKASLTDNKLSLIDLMLCMALFAILGSVLLPIIYLSIVCAATAVVLTLGVLIGELVNACIERNRRSQS